ncbi:hypothetical protein NF868_08250 [Bacillus zhangzhouensis]|nr:hypothetical protein NF868_08250 [Bacillus zhangzhouensis]
MLAVTYLYHSFFFYQIKTCIYEKMDTAAAFADEEGFSVLTIAALSKIDRLLFTIMYPAFMRFRQHSQ